MAGTISSITFSNPYGDLSEPNKIVIGWTSDASGDVTADIASTFADDQPDFGAKPNKLTGFIVKVDTNPDDVAAPTDLYDIVLNNADGIDVMAGALANRSTSNSEQAIPSDPPYVDSELSLAISAAGATKKGTITIYMVPSI